MKSDFRLAYRSLERPDPIWNECAVYGGYKYIEVHPGVWLPRELEYLVACLYTDIPSNLKEQAVGLLREKDRYIYPSRFQQSNYTKLIQTILKANSICIRGYSTALQGIVSSLYHTTIFSDKEYELKAIKRISEEELLHRTANTITIVSANDFAVKPYIKNWGNVIVYTDEMLQEESNLGGNYVTAKQS